VSLLGPSALKLSKRSWFFAPRFQESGILSGLTLPL
jgi:hypothetical protein